MKTLLPWLTIGTYTLSTWSSLCELCLRKFRQRAISSVVLWRRKPRHINISPVVDCLLITGVCCIPGGRLHGLGSRDEHDELSGDLKITEPMAGLLFCRTSDVRGVPLFYDLRCFEFWLPGQVFRTELFRNNY